MRLVLVAATTLLLLSGCLADSDKDGVVDPEPTCPAGHLGDFVTGYAAAGVGDDDDTFTVPAECTTLDIRLTDESILGDSRFWAESPNGEEHVFWESQGVRQQGSGAWLGTYNPVFSGTAVPGEWRLVASGNGAMEFHTTVNLS